MSIPTLNIWFKKYHNGNPVRGHAARCYAIATEWRKRGGGVKYFSRRNTAYEIILEDGRYSMLWSPLTVAIADSPTQEGFIYNSDVLVCPHPGAEFEGWNFDGVKLLGPKYFPRRPEFDEFEPQNNGYTAIIPGGNKEKFYNNVELGRFPDPKIEVENHSPRESARLISGASFVICSASTVAMEAMSLGKPTIIVKTSDDQELLWRYLPRLGAGAYNPGGCTSLSSYLSQLCIPPDGAKNLVDAILNEWEKKHG